VLIFRSESRDEDVNSTRISLYELSAMAFIRLVFSFYSVFTLVPHFLHFPWTRCGMYFAQWFIPVKYLALQDIARSLVGRIGLGKPPSSPRASNGPRGGCHSQHIFLPS